ncbi:dockerin type I domain-containing protein [uncultured Kordia sp.]|uniref:dockerin type I domain-containing protein n=1 Tax=uncultured Kordia sp. TaxID=507699 RepID=UPI00262F0FE9|nr:dockerin type I domain-containing protein [uncultured Kordia sp.]
MKNLKWIYACAMVTLLLVSCSKENVDTLDNDQATDLEILLKKYPAEMTIDNWEEFLYAPKEVMDYFEQKELKLRSTHEEIVLSDAQQERLIFGNYLLGEVQVIGAGIDPNTNYLGGTRITYDVNFDGLDDITDPSPVISFPNPIFGGQNFYFLFDTSSAGELCFYHENNLTGNYTYLEWINGVTTFDLIKINKHLLGIEVFTELWQYLAADVNGDGAVSTLDAIILRKLIANTTTELPAMQKGAYNQPVIYFPQDEYDAVNADLSGNLPFITAYYGNLTCQSISPTNQDTDTYAIKRGDLNGSWNF